VASELVFLLAALKSTSNVVNAIAGAAPPIRRPVRQPTDRSWFRRA